MPEIRATAKAHAETLRKADSVLEDYRKADKVVRLAVIRSRR